jgi:hypothetical protein
VVVQTHRDPLRVITSVAALATHLRRMASDDPSVTEAAAQYAEDIPLGLDRGMDARRRGVFPEDQVVDVHFTEFLADPLATVARIYGTLGRTLDGAVADRMRAFLDAHPGDGGGGGTRYRFADTGLDASAVRERVAAYQAHYGVAEEPLD